MTVLYELIGHDALHRAGWVLIHFLWQGAAVAAATMVALTMMRRRSAQARYVVSYAALVLAAGMPVATWFWLAPVRSIDASPDALNITTPAIPPEPPAFEQAAVGMLHESIDSNAPLISRGETFLPPLVGAWLIGVIALSIYRAGGWIYVQHLRHLGKVEHDSHLLRKLDRLRHAMRIGRVVRVLHCPRIDSPAVVGVIRPVILLPLGCLLNLTPQQLEAILAHELAHIRRHDYFINLIQTAIETVLFFHPAIWWMSRRIRIEREHAADDLALRAVPDRVAYAGALASLEELRTAPAPALAARGGPLLARVRRVLGQSDAPHRATWWPAAAIAALALAVVIALGSSAVSASDDEAQPATPQDTKSISITCVDAYGKPIAGAEVFLSGWFTDGESWRELAPAPVRSDDAGVARFEGLPNVPPDRGELHVYARRPGTLAGVQGQSANVEGGRPWDEPFKIIMKPAKSLKVRLTDRPPEVNVESLQAQLRSINNLLVDGPHTGGNFPRLRQIGKQGHWPEVFQYRIDRDGAFTVPDIPDNASVEIVVGGPGIATEIARQNFNRPDAGNEVAAKLWPEAIVEGSVFFDEFPRRAAAGVEIRCQHQPHSAMRGGESISIFTRAGEDGRFQVRGLRQGIYSLTIRDVPQGYASKPVHVRLEHGQHLDDVKISLDPGKLVRGTVVTADAGKPVPGAVVWSQLPSMYGIESAVSRSEPTDAQGRFAIRLPKGTMSLAITPPKGFGRGQRVTLEIPRGPEELPELVFRLGPSEPRPDEIMLERMRAPRGTLRGRVLDPQGKPLADVQVRMNQSVAGRMRLGIGTRTKQDGTYEFPNLESGAEYQVFIPEWNTTGVEADRVALEPNQTITLDDLPVTPRAVVSEIGGMVVDERGVPIADASVSVGQYFSVRTGADGAFRFDLYDDDEPVDLAVSAESYQRTVQRGIAPRTRGVRVVMPPKIPGTPEY